MWQDLKIKKMNLLTPKQQFLNQYRGQEVFYLDGLTKPKTAPFELSMDGDHALLRSINQLTDEECIKLASIVIENPFNRYRNIEVIRNYAIVGFPYISVRHKNVRYRFEIDCTHVNFSVYDMDELAGEIDMKPYACIDYLRSIGILLPFTYIDENNKPVTLQPDEIIALGWAKTSPDKLPIDAINTAC